MRPGTKRILAGVFIFLTGAIIVPLGIILSLIFNDPHEIIFKVPGSTPYTVEDPGRYYLWNKHQTIFEGVSYNRSESLPDGFQIRIINSQTGSQYAFVTDTSISSSSGMTAKNSIGYINIQQTGNIIIQISGGNEERIFSFSKFGLGELFGYIFGGIALSVFICLAGGVCVAWGIIAMSKSTQTKKHLLQNETTVCYYWS